MEISRPQNHYLRTSRFCKPLEFWLCHLLVTVNNSQTLNSSLPPQEILRASYTKKANLTVHLEVVCSPSPTPQAKNQTSLPGHDRREWASGLFPRTVLWDNSSGAFGPRNQITSCLIHGAWLFNQLPLSWQTVLSPAHK